jgi:protein gp37
VWGANRPRRLLSKEYWRAPYRWNRDAESADERRFVMCGSMCDVLESSDNLDIQTALNSWRTKLWELIQQTPHLTWLLTTKRTENIAAMLPPEFQSCEANVWVIASVENQQVAEKRIPELLAVPGNHGLSIEPLLDAIDLRKWLAPWSLERTGHRISWVIVGGESGPKARPMNPYWVCVLRDQCVESGVPFFFKQWGRWSCTGNTSSGYRVFGDGAIVCYSPRTEHAIPTLDGKQWTEMP